ncbi:MAG: hypothetical protein L6Q83_10540 [Gammaproteobacteria bacterium]|jgi:hypothetical protein|nr:hypothetical protein [Gammaproteobacteria bacterium]
MSWAEWLKGLTERRPGKRAGEPEPVRTRVARKGGEAYAREWVKVLEDTAPGSDPTNTYTWELDTKAAASRRRPPPPGKKAPAKEADPFDTYEWELHEQDSPEDPWGLKKSSPAPEQRPRDGGINPYDTGVFDATWTGRFDQR